MTQADRMQAALDQYATLRQAYAAMGEKYAKRGAVALNRFSLRLARAMAAGVNASGVAVDNLEHVERITRDMTAELGQLHKEVAAEFAAMFKESAEMSLRQIPEIAGAFGRTTTEAMTAARSAFIKDARGTLYQTKFTDWVDSFRGSGEALKAQMKKSLTRAQLEGWDTRQLAKDLLRQPDFQWKNLPPVSKRGMKAFMGDNLSASDALIRRAHVIARTEAQAVGQRMVRDWSDKAGITKYENVNGDPVSEICQGANEAGVMTWDEWVASEWGIPPRHPQCDSMLMPVPDDYEDVANELQERLAAEVAA